MREWGGTARSMALPPPPASVLWTEQSGWPQWDAGPDMLAKVCGEGRVARPPEISNPWFSGSAVNLRLGIRWLLPWFKDLFLKLSLSLFRYLFSSPFLLPSSVSSCFSAEYFVSLLSGFSFIIRSVWLLLQLLSYCFK